HGPLELTRRARVCVWDDLVEIPVAVPLRPSNDIRLMHNDIAKGPGIREEEEMDIGAAYASAPPLKLQTDLLGPDQPNNNRFNISRQNSSGDVRRSDESNAPLSPSSVQNFTFDPAKESRFKRPVAPRTKSRLSLDETRRLFDNLGERRRFSFAIGKRNDEVDVDDAELDGDLGFAAAEDQEGYRRKVIVERIEMVKGRAPVFTWC
ncbi:hypothetical protein KCU94_g12618, partial [Aureobasidium melanogenum]